MKTKIKLSAAQAKRLSLIERGFATSIPVKRGAFKAFDQKLLMQKLIWYTLRRVTWTPTHGSVKQTDRVLRLTTKGRRALDLYRSTH